MNNKIRLLLTLDGFLVAAFGLLGPVYAIFVERIGGDILDAGTAFAVYSLTLGAVAYGTGKLGDTFVRPVHFLFAGHVIQSVGFLSYLLVQTPLQLFAVQFVLGFGAAIENPAFDSLFSSSLDRGRRTSEWADWESMNFLINGFTALIGAAIAKFFGFSALFVVMAASSFVSLLLVYVFKRRGLHAIG